MIRKLVDSLLAVIYPAVCPVCGRVLVAGEEGLCVGCMLDMPLTGFHSAPEWNPLHERLMCHAPIHHATALFHYEKHSPYAALIHRAKYSGLPDEGRRLARNYAARIAPAGFFDGIDAIQPVPLSFRRLVCRGFNQSHAVALGVADVIGAGVVDLLGARHHSSQTRKSASARLENARSTYFVRQRDDAARPPRHILLVDDVITTGATLIACAEALHRTFPEMRLSVFTLAATRLS